MHQKSMLVDEEIVMVGATNYTRQSFRVNTESMFVIKNGELAGIFEARFLTDWRRFSDLPHTDTIVSRRIYYLLARWVSRYI
jgi:phosphatidylserine/phosphatidylglycerophosphate/cardiolipin synthase-like enzyme